MDRKKFLVLGHPRSGTGFMSKLFKAYGYDVGHEVMGKDGISSWMFAVEDYQPFTDASLNRRDFEFNHLIMVIRNPIDIISSTYYTEGASLEFRRKHIDLQGLTSMEAAVKSVLEWYRFIEAQNPETKIHVDRDPQNELFSFLKAVENQDLQPLTQEIGRVNVRSHPELSFSSIADNCHSHLLKDLVHFCNLYQYS